LNIDAKVQEISMEERMRKILLKVLLKTLILSLSNIVILVIISFCMNTYCSCIKHHLFSYIDF